MYKLSTSKRTGIYRVTGDINDFQIEIKLRHISEWLPVPKFEYTGAHAANSFSREQRKHYFRDSSVSSGWGWTDCHISIPSTGDGSDYTISTTTTTTFNTSNSNSAYSPNSLASATLSTLTSTSTSNTTAAITSTTTTTKSNNSTNSSQGVVKKGIRTSQVIGWQQKFFSPDEVQRFSDASNCTTPIQRRYHRWLRGTRDRSLAQSTESPLGIIHTQIDADSEDQSSEMAVEAQKLRSIGYSVMVVYAHLPEPTPLVSLHYSASTELLFVYPNFSHSAEELEYVVEIDSGYRQLFAYGFQQMESASSSLSPLLSPGHTPTRHQLLATKGGKSEQKQKVPVEDTSDSNDSDCCSYTTEQLIGYHQRQRMAAAELRMLSNFELPPQRMRRVVLLLQLQQAQHFENDNIHVRYYIQVPAHTLLETSQLRAIRGATHTCLDGGSTRPAHFAYSWQLSLICEETHHAEHLLHIYFEVISVDSWQRERNEGYAHYAFSLLAPLPSVAHKLQLQCTRPVGTWRDALVRRFIGGRKLFDFVRYFRPSRKLAMHNRYNQKQPAKVAAMQPTGVINFSVDKLVQHQPDAMYTIQRGGESASIITTLDEVLAAYVEARGRLEALLEHSPPMHASLQPPKKTVAYFAAPVKNTK